MEQDDLNAHLLSQMQRNAPYSAPMRDYGSSIILLTNPEQEIYRLELTLRNMIVDSNGNAKPIGEPLLNDRGIVRVLGITQGILNQVTIMSNFSKNEVPQLMEFLNDTICRDLMSNRLNYGITDKSARDAIHFNVLSYAFIALKRGFEEGDRRFWKGSQQDIRTEVVNANASKKGLLNSILGWAK